VLTLCGAVTQAQTLKNSVPNAIAAAPLSSNKIHFTGRYPSSNTNARYDPLDLCPNAVDPQTGTIASLAYQFEFQSDCIGEDGSPWGFGSYRPPFIWSLHYTTENGNYYNQQWQDQTNFDYSKVRFYLYDRVPITGTPTHPFVSSGAYSGGNPRVSTWCSTSGNCFQTNAVPGELITSVDIECTGYQCGFFGGNDNDRITVRYKSTRPKNLTIAGDPGQICRGQAYTLNWDSSFGAMGYEVQTSVGTITPNPTTGTTAQLFLPATTPGSVTSVTLTVSAQNDCGELIPASSTTILTLPVAPAPPRPTNMQLSNGLCPTTSTTDKSVSATKVGDADYFEWSISGSGAYFTINNAQTYSQPIPISAGSGSTISATIRVPQPGTLVVTSQQRTVCGGYGSALSNTYQIANLTAVCPTPVVNRSACNVATSTVVFDPTNAGLNYYLNGQPYNVSSGAVLTLTQSSPGSNTATLTGSGGGRFTFDQDVFITSPCAGVSTGFVSCAGATTVHLGAIKFIQGVCRDVAGGPQVSQQPETPATTLYPNPTSGLVEIRASQSARYQSVKVMNVNGHVLYEKQADTAAGLSSFDIRFLPMGLYEIQLFDGARLTTRRITRE